MKSIKVKSPNLKVVCSDRNIHSYICFFSVVKIFALIVVLGINFNYNIIDGQKIKRGKDAREKLQN